MRFEPTTSLQESERLSWCSRRCEKWFCVIRRTIVATPRGVSQVRHHSIARTVFGNMAANDLACPTALSMFDNG